MFLFLSLIWSDTLTQIPGRLWCYRRRVGDSLQWLWSRQPCDHPVWQVLRPSKRVRLYFWHCLTKDLASKFTCHWRSLFSFPSFAYIEFSDRDSVHSAIGLHETMFRGRVLKVRSIYVRWHDITGASSGATEGFILLPSHAVVLLKTCWHTYVDNWLVTL